MPSVGEELLDTAAAELTAGALDVRVASHRGEAFEVVAVRDGLVAVDLSLPSRKVDGAALFAGYEWTWLDGEEGDVRLSVTLHPHDARRQLARLGAAAAGFSCGEPEAFLAGLRTVAVGYAVPGATRCLAAVETRGGAYAVSAFVEVEDRGDARARLEGGDPGRFTRVIGKLPPRGVYASLEGELERGRARAGLAEARTVAARLATGASPEDPGSRSRGGRRSR